MKVDDSSVERLLRRGEISEAAAARVLDDVLEKTLPRRRRTWVWATAGAVGALAAVGSLLIWVGTRSANDPSLVRTTDGLRAKGLGAETTVAIHCVGGELTACSQGSRLLFHVGRLSQPAYLVAFAEHAGGRVVYFPDARGKVPKLEPGPSRLLDQAVAVGPEHRPGSYRIRVLLLAQPPADVGDIERSTGSAMTSATVPLEVTR